jgi:murein DD-endopeptidase MepM/ murein hydrolase activator NlpD
VDISAARGTPIYAVKPGKAEFVGTMRGYGLTVVIKHKNFKSLYAHCHKIAIANGVKVRQGQVIAYVGTSGNARTPHLHFETQSLDGTTHNPLNFLHGALAP